jgi:hypothetical protein
LLDKITILQIKRERIGSAAARANVAAELALLMEIAGAAMRSGKVAATVAGLSAINEALWIVEDDIRRCEAAADFGPVFVELARSVYQLNDRRAELKREINQLLGSSLVEEKSYASLTAPALRPA